MPSLRDLLFPSFELSLVTLLSPDAARQQLLAASSRHAGISYLRRRRAGQRFVRVSEGEPLVLERLVPYPDPWRPLLDVTLSPRGSGTDVKVRLRLSRGGEIVTAIWHALAVIVGLGALIAVLAGVILPRGLILTALAVVYAALPALDQRVERRATRQALEEILEKCRTDYPLA